jgi:hypothetical protein
LQVHLEHAVGRYVEPQHTLVWCGDDERENVEVRARATPAQSERKLGDLHGRGIADDPPAGGVAGVPDQLRVQDQPLPPVRTRQRPDRDRRLDRATIGRHPQMAPAGFGEFGGGPDVAGVDQLEGAPVAASDTPGMVTPGQLRADKDLGRRLVVRAGGQEAGNCLFDPCGLDVAQLRFGEELLTFPDPAMQGAIWRPSRQWRPERSVLRLEQSSLLARILLLAAPTWCMCQAHL